MVRPVSLFRAFGRPPALLLGIAVGGLIGCATPERPPSDLARREAPTRETFAARDPLSLPEGTARDRWVEAFNEPVLVALTREAVEHNPDLRRAAAVWDEARARLRSARSFLSPRIDAVGEASRSKRAFGAGEPITSSQYSIEAQASWELDLWGRVRASAQAAEYSALAARADYAGARQSIAAAVVDAWLLSVQAREKLEIDRILLETEQRTARVTGDKVDAGVGTQLDAELAQSNVALARAAVSDDLRAIDELTRALESLLGRYPSAELATIDTLPPFPGAIAVGVPSQLVGRRPDLVAADRRVAAAFSRVQSDRAARLPSLTLTASLGAVLDPTDEIWSIGAGLLAPIFNAGRLDAQVEISTAQQEQAVAGYVATAIDAFREVENALGSERYLAQREDELSVAAEHLREASRVGEDRYNAGILSIVDLTTIRRQDFQSRIDLLQVRTDRLRQRLTLYRALGGSFDEHASLYTPPAAEHDTRASQKARTHE